MAALQGAKFEISKAHKGRRDQRIDFDFIQELL